jgi:hypothetical protein
LFHNIHNRLTGPNTGKDDDNDDDDDDDDDGGDIELKVCY